MCFIIGSKGLQEWLCILGGYTTALICGCRFTYQFEFQSSIGLLDDTNHYGGLYSGAYASDIIADVIGGKIPYTIKQVFSKINHSC